MSDDNTPQDSAAMSPASAGSTAAWIPVDALDGNCFPGASSFRCRKTWRNWKVERQRSAARPLHRVVL